MNVLDIEEIDKLDDKNPEIKNIEQFIAEIERLARLKALTLL